MYVRLLAIVPQLYSRRCQISISRRQIVEIFNWLILLVEFQDIRLDIRVNTRLDSGFALGIDFTLSPFLKRLVCITQIRFDGPHDFFISAQPDGIPAMTASFVLHNLVRFKKALVHLGPLTLGLATDKHR